MRFSVISKRILTLATHLLSYDRSVLGVRLFADLGNRVQEGEERGTHNGGMKDYPMKGLTMTICFLI
jgi:hypothetical protein